MARRKLVETSKTEVTKQVQLSNLVAMYGNNKSKFDTLKKECDVQNAEIKTLMSELNCTEYTSGGYTAKYSIQHRESMNEDKLLELLSEDYQYYLDLGIIKQKDYIDSDMLEDAIYHNKIDKDTILKMDLCRETKDVPTLKISKSKENKK